jgi:single-strand DNA-binding protein
MRGFNKVILVGNLTRDPQLKYLPSQTAVAEFGIAMNRKWRDQQGQDREEVCFVDCAAFGKTGEFVNQYFQKGKPILIEGRLKYDQWEDKQGGGKRSKLSVVVETCSFIGGPDGGGNRGGAGGPAYDDVDTGGGGGGGGSAGGAGGPPPAKPMNRGPARPPQQGPARPAPEQPFSEEQQFKDDDIPF